MRAITDFAATRELIVYAFKVFSEGFEKQKLIEIQNREAWIETQIKSAWFNKSREYWTAYANGEKGDLFERYRMKDNFRAENQVWYEARLEDASQLLQKFDCAVDQCEAHEITLTDKDLTLLSVSLESAEINQKKA